MKAGPDTSSAAEVVAFCGLRPCRRVAPDMRACVCPQDVAYDQEDEQEEEEEEGGLDEAAAEEAAGEETSAKRPCRGDVAASVVSQVDERLGRVEEHADRGLVECLPSNLRW